jgi:hypothetical protein
VRGAEAHAGLGHPGVGPGGGQGDAEIGRQRAAIVQQDVLGLDVAVDHALAVGVVSALATSVAMRTASALEAVAVGEGGRQARQRVGDGVPIAV